MVDSIAVALPIRVDCTSLHDYLHWTRVGWGLGRAICSLPHLKQIPHLNYHCKNRCGHSCGIPLHVTSLHGLHDKPV